MSLTWTNQVAGAEITPFIQLYACRMNPDLQRGELLSRPAGRARVDEYFDSLSYEEHLDVLRWQLELKESFSGSTGFRLSINVHNSLVATMDQRVLFLGLLEEYPTPATFEFTETHPMPPVAESNFLLRSVRELGHLSALDDFGTGLNGMSLLTDYDFDVVKIDRSLVYDIHTRLEKRKTVKLIGQMLGVLGKKHVVEGVELAETQEILVEEGFTTFQGFGIHRPEPLAVVAERLSGEAEVRS